MTEARKSAAYLVIPAVSLLLIVISVFPSLLQPGQAESKEREIAEAIDKNDISTLDRLVKSPEDANADVALQLPALLAAAVEGRTHAARLLVERGADIDAASQSGWTAMHEAAYSNSPEIISILVSAGAHVNVVNSKGDTPLIIAAQSDCPESVHRLLMAGANAAVTNRDGQSALSLAVAGGHFSNASLLLGAMSNRLEKDAVQLVASCPIWQPFPIPFAVSPLGLPAAGSPAPALRMPARTGLTLQRPRSPQGAGPTRSPGSAT